MEGNIPCLSCGTFPCTCHLKGDLPTPGATAEAADQMLRHQAEPVAYVCGCWPLPVTLIWDGTGDAEFRCAVCGLRPLIQGMSGQGAG